MPLEGTILEHSIQLEIHNYSKTRIEGVEVYFEGEEEVLSKLTIARSVSRVYLENNRKSKHINGDDKETYVLISWNADEKKRYWGNYKNATPMVTSDFANYSLKIVVAGANRKKEEFELSIITVPLEPPFFAVLGLENHINR